MNFGRHRRRRSFFGEGGGDHAHIAGPLIGGGAVQIGIMLAHLHARKNPKALRHAGLHGLILGALVGGGLAASHKHRQTGISALATVAIMTIPRILEGFMGLGHREETSAMNGLGIITPEQYQALSDSGGDPAVQLLDSGNGSTGVFGTHVAEEIHPLAGPPAEGVELLGGGGFGANFLEN